MHPTAALNADRFFKTYLRPEHPGYFAIEIGSQIVREVRGSLKDIVPPNVEYVGVDVAAGDNVDVVLTDPYELPFPTESVDVCIASSVLEHSEMFWLLFLEILRILRPAGIFYLNVPSNGYFHRFPVDCWRFYPDSGRALVNWGRRNGFDPALLESYTSAQNHDVWNDFVAVFVRSAAHAGEYPRRIIEQHKDFSNGLVYGSNEFLNRKDATEDMLKLETISKIATGRVAVR